MRPAVEPAAVPGGVGDSPHRPDAAAKVAGSFRYASDLRADGMLWGATVRSPHPRARITGIDTAAAAGLPGVHAVLTHADLPGAKRYGLERADQPVLAIDEVRYHGEPVAVVAAEDPGTARRAAARVEVAYEVSTPVVDPEAALRPGAASVHPDGDLLRHVPIRWGDPRAAAEVVVTGEYQVGMQDQAFLGPEAGLAVPDGHGGIDLHLATQWLHVDQRQVAGCLALPPERVRLVLAGVGGAFGGREDLSMQVHACLLALRTGRPVAMVYSRRDSFLGHPHRHPARLRYEHGADRDGRLVYVRARVLLDGGAYASSSTAVCANAASLGVGPYRVPHGRMDAYVVYTNNPPCGAMRGFGAVQTCFAYESQMDRLADALGLDPVEVRIRNALRTGDRMPTGQRVDGPAPVADLLRQVRAAPAARSDRRRSDRREPVPGDASRGAALVRGVGYGVGIKNVCYSEGFDDYATARVRLEVSGGTPRVVVHTAAAEVGQGVVTVQQQIARTELGVAQVRVAPADTTVGSAGSASASRQTYVVGGAVRAACAAIRERLLARVDPQAAPGTLRLVEGTVCTASGQIAATLADLLRQGPVEETVRWRHRPTQPLDPVSGQGDAHVQFAFAAHRATVEVDRELGLVRVVEIVTAQDVGKAVNPQAVEGQIHGGTLQGLGLALMEELRVCEGAVDNPSFADYLIPTALDAPPMRVELREEGDPAAPYGLRGVGEPPAISATPAVVAAVRAATGCDLTRVPVRPEHIALE